MGQTDQRLTENSEVQFYMNGDSYEENQRGYFEKQFGKFMVEYVNDRVEFYKMVEDNSSMKKMICELMFSNYQTQETSADFLNRWITNREE